MDTMEVRDGSRMITFDGEMIASVTSRSSGSRKPRWSEYRLYRTEDQSQYVLEKVGCSIVVHAPGCPEIIDKLPRFQEQFPGEDPMNGWWLCESCAVRGGTDLPSLLVEKDRHWVVITADPAQVVDALYRRKDGARHLPRLSLELLDEASAVDDRIAGAFRVERL